MHAAQTRRLSGSLALGARQIVRRAGALLRHPLALLMLAFCCNTLLWATVVPAFGAPDELAHVENIRHVAARGSLPVFGSTAYVSNPDALNPQAMQQPLYYLLAAPVRLLLGPHQEWESFALRAFSALLGLGAVCCAYALGRALAPRTPLFALTCAALVGFNPMFTAMSAAVNNDNLVNLVYAALLLVWWRGVVARRAGAGWLLGLGALLGAGVLAKLSITAGVAVSALLLLWLAWRRPRARLRWLARAGALSGGALLLVGGWSLWRNWQLYGDPTALWVFERFPALYEAHPYARVGTLWEMLTTSRPRYRGFWQAALYGFWGVFDSYTLWMSRRAYALLCVLLASGGLGALLALGRLWRRRSRRAAQTRLAFGAGCALLAGAVLWSLVSRCYQIDYQPQGRYLLPALLPVALGLTAGAAQLAGPARRPRALALLLALIVAANLTALFGVLAPTYNRGYLRDLAGVSAAAARPVYGAAAAQVDFVARQAPIDELVVSLANPQHIRTPLVVRLRDAADARELAAAVVEDEVDATALRLRLDVRQVQFSAGRRYRLLVQAPWSTADHPVLLYGAGAEPQPSDLAPAVVYAGQGWSAEALGARLRTVAPDSPLSPVQTALFVLAPLLLLLLVARAGWAAGGPAWGLVALAALGLLAAALAGPAIATPGNRRLAEGVAQMRPGGLRHLPGPQADSTIDLLLLSGGPEARKQPPDEPERQISAIQPYRIGIGRDERAVLAMQPTSAITYTILAPPGARFDTALALNPQVWQPDKGDGVEFVVRARAGGQTRELLRRYLDPKHNPQERRWNDVQIDLAAYAGQQIDLTLEVLPGPRGDPSYDWAAWAAPVLRGQEQAP